MLALYLTHSHVTHTYKWASAGGSSSWQGMAPLAKTAFQDLGTGTSSGILVPGDLANGYFPFSYARQFNPPPHPPQLRPCV